LPTRRLRMRRQRWARRCWRAGPTEPGGPCPTAQPPPAQAVNHRLNASTVAEAK
jgi:hypothetical protein